MGGTRLSERDKETGGEKKRSGVKVKKRKLWLDYWLLRNGRLS